MKSDTILATKDNNPTEKAPSGFFGRLFQKIDASMKRKAEAQSGKCCCSSGDSAKGDKCC